VPEYAAPGPATDSAFQAALTFAAHQNDRLLPGPWAAISTLAPEVVIAGLEYVVPGGGDGHGMPGGVVVGPSQPQGVTRDLAGDDDDVPGARHRRIADAGRAYLVREKGRGTVPVPVKRERGAVGRSGGRTRQQGRAAYPRASSSRARPRTTAAVFAINDIPGSKLRKCGDIAPLRRSRRPRGCRLAALIQENGVEALGQEGTERALVQDGLEVLSIAWIRKYDQYYFCRRCQIAANRPLSGLCETSNMAVPPRPVADRNQSVWRISIRLR
jgi:hypothetical protein